MEPYSASAWNFTKRSRLVVLTGAGISAESGIRTFRDSGGMWENHDIEDVATPAGFQRDPLLVIQFYNQRRQQLSQVQPNPAHVALARLARVLGDRMLLVTQNVDDLHERGGSQHVLHMHGELGKLRCTSSSMHMQEFHGQQGQDDRCQQCEGRLRPHIVWFGEVPFHLDRIEAALFNCTHFVYIGTSSQVYPAAGFRHTAKSRGAKVLCINLQEEWDPATDLYLVGNAGTQVPLWVDSMVGSQPATD